MNRLSTILVLFFILLVFTVPCEYAAANLLQSPVPEVQIQFDRTKVIEGGHYIVQVVASNKKTLLLGEGGNNATLNVTFTNARVTDAYSNFEDIIMSPDSDARITFRECYLGEGDSRYALIEIDIDEPAENPELCVQALFSIKDADTPERFDASNATTASIAPPEADDVFIYYAHMAEYRSRMYQNFLDWYDKWSYADEFQTGCINDFSKLNLAIICCAWDILNVPTDMSKDSLLYLNDLANQQTQFQKDFATSLNVLARPYNGFQQTIYYSQQMYDYNKDVMPYLDHNYISCLMEASGWYNEDWSDLRSEIDSQRASLNNEVPIICDMFISRAESRINAGSENDFDYQAAMLFRALKAYYSAERNYLNNVRPEYAIPPEKPISSSPLNGAVNIPIVDTTFSWSCNNPEGDNVYDLYLSSAQFTFANPPIPTITDIQGTTAIIDTLSLIPDSDYYWGVVAKDAYSTAYSDIWHFRTGSAPVPTNHPPSTPTPYYPEDGAVDISTISWLFWDCCDPDDDLLHYNVYLGTRPNSLSLVKAGATSDQFDPDLDYDTTYYWKVTATDGVHSVTGGPWSFTTISASSSLPTVTITLPEEGATVGQTVTVVADVTDTGGIDRSSIAVTVNGQAATLTDTVPIENGYRATAVSNNVAIGDVPIVVTARDIDGNEGTDSVYVTVALSDITITEPLDGLLTNLMRPPISAAFVHVNSATIRMFLNNNDITDDCIFTGSSNDGTIALNYATFGTLTDGTYTVVVNGTSSLDASTRSDTVTFTLETTPIADFNADVTCGAVPLTVQFTDMSSQNATGRAWYFGDEDMSGSWIQINASAPWGERNGHTSIALPDGSIVLAGGSDQCGYRKNDVWRSTDYGATWTEVTAGAAWTGRSGHSSVAMSDGSIILMGGFSYWKENDVWQSDDGGATWRRVTANAGWSAREGHSCVAMPDGSIVLMGGNSNTFLENDVWRSTDGGATWSCVNASAGWMARERHTAVALPDGSIVLMGGNSYGAMNDVWRSTDSGATWTQLTSNAEWMIRESHSSIALPDGSIVLMGGIHPYYAGTSMNDIWRSHDLGATWTRVTASADWGVRGGHTAVALPDGSIILMGGNTDYRWMLNDVWRVTTAGSSARNPSHTYTEPGTYSVTLQAFNAAGYDCRQKIGYITVPGPVADFSANVTSGLAPLTVRFTDTSTGNPTSWLWTFGSGEPSTEQHPVHTYTTAGTFTVSLTVTNTSGSDTVTKAGLITVTIPEGPPIVWQHCFGGSSWDHATSIQQTSDGGYIVAGYTDSTDGDVSGNHGGDDFWLLKLDSAGNPVWKRCLGGSGSDSASSIQQTSDGGYVVAGYTNSFDGDVSGNHGGDDFWLLKLDSAGNLAWQRCLGGSGCDYAESIQQTSDGGYIVAGSAYSTDGDVSRLYGYDDMWVVKLDAGGSLEWQRCFGGSRGDCAYSVRQTSDSGYILAGYTDSTDGDVSGNHGLKDAWMVKLDAGGSLEWQRCLGGSLLDVVRSVQQTPDGGYIAVGDTYSTDGDLDGNLGSNDLWVVKLDADGSLDWQRCLGGSGSDSASSIQQTSDGGFIVAGYTNSFDGDVSGNNDWNDFWVLKLDSAGNPVWQRCLGGSGCDYAESIQQTSDGGYVVAGYTRSFDGDVGGNHGGDDVWVVKLARTGQDAVQAANFTANITSGTTPLTVQFTDLSTGNPTAWLWQFGDGNTSTEQHPVHTYTLPGNYSVSLTVSNGVENSTATQEQYIHVQQPLPHAALIFNVNFNRGTSNDTIASGMSPCRVAYHTGVFNDEGSRESISGNLSVLLDAPGIIDFSPDTCVEVNGTQATWHFPPSTMIDPGRTLSTSATTSLYAPRASGVTLERSYNRTAFTETGVQQVTLNMTFDTTGLADLWGRLECSNTTDVCPAFISGTVSTDLPLSGTSEGSARVQFTINHSLIELGRKYTLSCAVAVDPLRPVAYVPSCSIWEVSNITFADAPSGTAVTLPAVLLPHNVSRVAFSSASYCDWLCVRNDQTITSLRQRAVPITLPVADFTANVTSGFAPLAVQFTDQSTGPITNWFWTFGDGAASTVQHPMHIFTAPGDYAVNLTVSNQNGSDTLVKTDCINVTRIKGDLNGDGDVDIGDVAKVAYMVVGKTPADPAADFNENGVVDIGDAAKIAYFFIGKIGAL